MIDLNTLLQKYPWEEPWKSMGKHMDNLWEFDLSITREEVWPYLIDTSSFNKRIGLPRFQYLEKEGKLFGKTKQAGFQLEWEEVPWEWEYLKEIGNARIYKRGFAKYVRIKILAEPLGESRCKVYVYLGAIPRNFFTKKILEIALPRLKESFQKGFKEIEEEIKLRKPKLQSISGKEKTFFPEAQWIHPEKLDKQTPILVEKGIQKETIAKVFTWIKQSPDNELDRIRIKSVSRLLDLNPDEVLFLFLHGCRLGIFTLSWDIVCPHCRGVRTSLTKLGDMPAKDQCDVCEIDFDTTGVNSIEVTFHLHPSVRIVEKQMYCAAEPATKQHILLTKRVGGRKSFSSSLLIGSGVYRLRKKGEKKYRLVESKQSHNQTDILWLPETNDEEIKVIPKPNLVFENDLEEDVTIVLEERSEDQNSLRPSEIFDYQEFRDLFSEEAIATNLQLDIGIKTILFTDIVGSTKFYETEGDHGAFLQVREHFIKTNQIIQNFRGVVVKTIGDAVMASFSSPLQALKAAKEMQEWFHPENKHTPVRIRISIHTGNCLAVNLNSNIDYFGNTVNYTAKIQSVTNSGEISFSETIFRDKDIREYLRNNDIKLKKVEFPLPWANRTDFVYIWKV
ncbi:adenylate/guanylate cyclase catalytic domain protein [Leptospira yanagawae serovar Saopaulo str. Sao Paulo = ATCC 700523]|uniref:Adenylate/guanylate cyclase catalytic domain protein n=1 Tax=Leptospira yanagawae serovar Saopaulo str. Sao Paulo = ATCC 700523 TaxID=1249483 RepID=A0A5E8HB40_9LEPT|nr:adenylate/guanylate cyclase domain-containing protein [Leptospira yanagawae]EOQ87860.1 adenylate/guanylate cyclase catalytic domain protein [Leptospira yanagawae serovar Saopaulo str. Sao Paulo = ATCC 700523]